MPNESNIIEEHLRIVIDPSTYSEIDKISESVRNMREDFSEMPHLGEMLNSSLERTSTLTDTVNRKLKKASDITFDTQNDRDRFSANAHASVEDLRVMHKLQSTNDDFNPTVVRSWAKGLSSALSKELDAIIPDLAGIFRSRMSPLTTAGNSAYKNTFQEVAGLSQAMFQDKSVQQLLKSRVTQSYSDDVIKQLLRVVVANNSPMMRLDDYTKLRYNSNVRENAKAAELNSPIALLPASFQSSFKNKGYLSRGEDANEQRKWLTASAYKVIQKLLAENPVAVNAAVRSGIARRDDRGVLELQRNISRKDYDDLRRSIYGEFTARATGAGEHRVADIYTDDPAAAKIVAGRMAGSSSAGSVIRAMQQLETLESAEAWIARQRQGSTYIKQPKEPKRALDQYSILSFSPFDSTKRPQKEVSITESNNTRLLGLQSRGYNGDASDTIATISLSGYDKNNTAHVAELRKLFEEGKEIQSISGKTVRMRVQSMHRGDDGAILRLVEESAMAAVDEQLRPIAEAAGLSGSYWTNYQNTDKFDDLVHYRKHLDARNKGWTPSADLGLNLDGKRIAVVSMSTVDGDHKTELADGTGWLSEGILPTPIQFRGGVSGKGTLRPLPGETNRDFAIRSGLATQDQDGQWHWYVQGANPNDAPIDIIDYNGFVDKSVIKNMSAYRNADGTLKTSEEINDTFMEMLRISPLSVVKDFSKMDSESDRIGVQMMSFMDISPELQKRQQQQLSKRLQELDTEEGMLKYVFPASNEDYLSTQVNDPEKRWLLQGAEAQKRVALYREELMRKAMSGEWIDFGDDPNDTISNVELAGSPLAAFFRMNGVNDNVRKIAREALAKEFGKEYSDQEIDDILKLRGTKRNADGTIEYGYGIDFGRADQEELGFLRSPTGYGNMVVARNVVKEVQAIYAALAGNIPEGMDSSMFSKDFLEAGGVILAPEDLKTLSGADLDADTVKTVTGSLKDAVKSTIEHTVIMPEKDTQLQIAKRKQDGIISDSVDNQIAAVDDLTYEPLGMGLYSGAIRGRQFDPTNPEYIERIRGFHKGQVGYDATTTIFKDPKEIARDKDIDKAIAAGKEYTRFTQNVKDIFSLDEDMYDDKGNVLDTHQDMYRASNGTIINMRKLKELDLLHTNLPSVYMDNHVLGLASMGRQYREGRVDTTRFDAMAEALSHMSEYDQELYNTAGVQTKALMDTVNQLYPQFGTGKRTKLTEDETKQLRELYDNALGEIVQQAMEQEVAPGRVLNNEGKQVSTNWLVHNLKKKYGLTRVENTLKEFGFTDDRLAVGLPESLQEFFVNSADAQLNIPDVSQVNVAAVASNAPQIVERLNKAKEEAAAEINKLEQEKAELDEKLFGKEVAGGVLSAPMTQEEHDQAENRRSEINRLIEAKQSEYQNADAMQRQAIEWYKDQVEFESVFASAREFNSGLWKSRLSKEAHIEDKSKADLYYNKQHGIAKYHATMLDDLIKRTGLSGEQKENLIKLRSDILSGVDVDFADKTVSNAKYLSESLNARVEATSVDYDKSEHEIDEYIKKLKEAEEYQKKLIDMDSEGKFAEEIKQTGEYITSGYQTAEKLRHNLYTQDIAGEDKMIDRLQRFTRDRNRRYSQSAFERQMLVNENDYEQYEQQYEAIAHRLSIWQSRRRGLAANGQIDTENYKLATQEINRLSSALSECQKEMDALSGASGKLNAGLTVAGQAANRVITQFGHRIFNQAIHEAQNFVTTYDASMTEIQMVTLKTEDEISVLGDGLIDKAVELRARVSDVTSAATSLYRQGLDDAEVDSRLEDVIKFSKTAKVSATDSIKLATVAMNSGDVESTDRVFDVVSALGDSAATEAAQITKGLQKSMAAATSVGVSFEDLVAMLTVVTSKTQLSGSVAGTTMRNIMSRMTRFGDQDSRYADQVQLLKNAGVEIFDDGEMRSVTDILSEIGALWESFDDRTKADIAYALGGTEQFSNVTALMQGFSETDETGQNLVQKYIALANASDGITDKKYQHQVESLDGALTNLQTTFDKLVDSAESTGIIVEFIDGVANGVAGFADLNTQTDGWISRIGALSIAIAGLLGLAKTNPYLLAMLGIGGVMLAAGKSYHAYSERNKPQTIYDQRIQSNAGFDAIQKQIDDASEINEKRIAGKSISDEEYDQLVRTLTSLNASGQLSFDGLTDSAGNAITNIDELAKSAEATSLALSGAATNISEEQKNRNLMLSLSAANAVDDSKTKYSSSKYEHDHSGLNEFMQFAETEDGEQVGRLNLVKYGLEAAKSGQRGTFNTEVFDFAASLASAGALHGAKLQNGDTVSSLIKDGKYNRTDIVNAMLDEVFSDNAFTDGSLLSVILEYANGINSFATFADEFQGFGDYNSDNIYQSIIGRDDVATSGVADLLHKTIIADVNTRYAQDENFDFSNYIDSIFAEGYKNYLQRQVPEEYAELQKDTNVKQIASDDPVVMFSEAIASAKASQSGADYEKAIVTATDIMRTAPGSASERLRYFAEQITNEETGLKDWDEVIRAKGSEALVSAWSSLVETDDQGVYRIRTDVSNEEADAFERILAGMSDRTSLMGQYRSSETIATSAQNTFNKMTADGVDAYSVWQNLSIVDELNKLAQSELIQVLGEDLVYQLINGMLDADGVAYAQSRIDAYKAESEIQPGYYQEEIKKIIQGLTGSYSEQMNVYSDQIGKQMDFEKSYKSMKDIAGGVATTEDFSQIASILGLDVEAIKKMASTTKGQEKLKQDLDKRFGIFKENISKALLAFIPADKLSTAGVLSTDDILEKFGEYLTDAAIAMIEAGNWTYDGEGFVIPTDGMVNQSASSALDSAYSDYLSSNNAPKLIDFLYELAKSSSGSRSFGAHLDSSRDTPEGLDEFFSGNTAMMLYTQAYRDGQITKDAYMARINHERYYGSEKDTAYYDSFYSDLLGEDYRSGDIVWEDVLAKYTEMSGSAAGLADLATMSEIPEFSDVLNELGSVANGTSDSFDRCEKAAKKFNDAVSRREASKLNAYKKNAAELDRIYDGISAGGMDAARTIMDVNEGVRDLNNIKWAAQQFKAGNRSNNVLSVIKEQLGLDDVSELKTASKEYAEQISAALSMGISDEETQIQNEMNTATKALFDKGIDEILQNAGEIDLGSFVNLNGSVDISGLLNAMSQSSSVFAQQFVEFIKYLTSQGATLTATAEADGSQMSFNWNTDGIKGGTYRGGGGRSGGSKKSDADKLVERIGHGKSLYEHQIKMVQYEQTRYQNADQLGNYGRMLQEQIKIERAYLPVLEDNIRALEDELANVEEGTEDWYKLRDAILEAEEMYADITNSITENTKKLKENEQAILKLRTDLEDMVVSEIELRLQAEEDKLSGSVSMQETILNAIKERYRDEWDLIKQDIEKKKEALQEEKDLIDERLDARREAEDEAAKYEELAELKKQLSLVSMDSTRTKDAAALRESIAELEKEIGWDIAEKEAENEKNAIQDQIDAYDDYVTKGDEDLEELLDDANNFSEEVNSVLMLSQSELFNWLKENVKEYANSLDDAQTQMVKSWEDTYKQMLGITDTYWKEVNLILRSKDSFLNYMKQSNEYIYASDDERQQLLYQWEEAYVKWRKAQIKDAEYDHDDDGLGGTSGDEYDDDGGKGGSSGGSGGSSGGNTGGSGGSTGGTQTNTPPYTVYDSDRKSYGTFQSYTEAATVARSVSERVGGKIIIKDKNGKTIGSYGGVSGGSGGTTQNLPETGWPSWLSSTSDHGYWWKVTQNGKNVAVASESVPSREEAQTLGAMEAKKYAGGKYQTKYFLHGGLADFTGPAWLDGTLSEPERILSAQQTQSFDHLVRIMDEMRNNGVTMSALRDMARWSSSVRIPSSLSYVGDSAYQGSTSSIGDIFVNITEAQISDDRDIEELANIVGQKFVKEISKQGFNTARYHF